VGTGTPLGFAQQVSHLIDFLGSLPTFWAAAVVLLCVLCVLGRPARAIVPKPLHIGVTESSLPLHVPLELVTIQNDAHEDHVQVISPNPFFVAIRIVPRLKIYVLHHPFFVWGEQFYVFQNVRRVIRLMAETAINPLIGEFRFAIHRIYFSRSSPVVREHEMEIRRVLEGSFVGLTNRFDSLAYRSTYPRAFGIDLSSGIITGSLSHAPNFFCFIPNRFQCAYRYDNPDYRNDRRYPDREDFWGYYFVPIARLLSPFIVLLGAILLYKTHDITAPFVGQWLHDAPGIVLITIGVLLMFDPMGW